jgi:hypothetical protein
VFGAGAVFSGIQMADAIDEFDASGDRDADARDRAVTYRTLTWVAGGVSLACATTAIVLFASGGGSRERARAPRFELGVRGKGAAARLRF